MTLVPCVKYAANFGVETPLRGTVFPSLISFILPTNSCGHWMSQYSMRILSKCPCYPFSSWKETPGFQLESKRVNNLTSVSPHREQFLTKFVNNSTDLRTSWEAKRTWAIQEIPRIFLKTECSLPCLQQPATISYPKPNALSPHHVLTNCTFHIALAHMLMSYKQSLSVSYYNRPITHFDCCSSFGFLQICFHLLPIRATCPSHLFLLGFITAISDIFIVQLLQHYILFPMRQGVAQMVGEGRGFDSRWFHWNFSLT